MRGPLARQKRVVSWLLSSTGLIRISSANCTSQTSLDSDDSSRLGRAARELDTGVSLDIPKTFCCAQLRCKTDRHLRGYSILPEPCRVIRLLSTKVIACKSSSKSTQAVSRLTGYKDLSKGPGHACTQKQGVGWCGSMVLEDQVHARAVIDPVACKEGQLCQWLLRSTACSAVVNAQEDLRRRIAPCGKHAPQSMATRRV